MKISNDKELLKQFLHSIDATIVLHNMLIHWNKEEDKIDTFDKSVNTNLTSIDAASRASVVMESEVLDRPIPNGGSNDL
jgi:hypothetical protein